MSDLGFRLNAASTEAITIPNPTTFSGTVTFTGSTVNMTGVAVVGMTLSASVVAPDTDDGAALGSGSLRWSDLFLASGAVINWLNGSTTLTHSAGVLTLGGSASHQSLVLGAVGTDFSIVAYGDTSGCSFTWDGANDQLTLVQTNAAVTGVEQTVTISQTHTGVGASAEVLAVTLTANTIFGTYANAFCAKINLSTTGGVTGLAGVICAELDMPGGAIAGSVGTYAVYEAEINCPTSYNSAVPIVVFSINAWGAAVGKFDDYGLLFDLTGVTSGAAHMWYDKGSAITVGDVAEVIKVRTPGGVRYLTLYDSAS